MMLLIGHDASRTGASKFLLNFATWLTKEKKEQVFIVLRRGGPLESEYLSVTKTIVAQEIVHRSIHLRAFRFLAKIFGQSRWMNNKLINLVLILKIKNLKLNGLRVVFCNTSTNAELLKIVDPDIPVISRIPEMGFDLMNKYHDSFRYTAARSSKLIAVSETVKFDLIKLYASIESKTSVTHGTVPEIELSSEPILRKQLGIPDEAIVISGSGTINWRKGTDLFLQVAQHIIQNNKSHSDIYFVWIGGDLSSEFSRQLLFETKKLNLENRVFFTGDVENPHSYYADIDLFLMTSRQDPFPLVNLEVGHLGKPIICFADSGGSSELLDFLPHLIVPFINVCCMASVALLYINEKRLMLEHGNQIKEHISKTFNHKRALEKIYALLLSNSR